jgi:hypothetical protein
MHGIAAAAPAATPAGAQELQELRGKEAQGGKQFLISVVFEGLF